MNTTKARMFKYTSLFLLLLPYLFYVAFVINENRGPVDYETFMGIGQRMLAGAEVYGENSYYPMPYVMVFGLFAWLPRPVSMAVWLLGPVMAALWITRGNPLTLLFAPLFGHFVGGQTAVFSMLGLWGYRRNSEPARLWGGVFLALAFMKPQLGIFPLAFAAVQWWKDFRARGRIPSQAWGWLAAMAVIFLPGFLLVPDWPVRWLSTPRPLFERAMSGLIPRTLLYLLRPGSTAYWLSLIGLAALLFAAVWLLNRRRITLDLTILWSFVVSPLVHDYDLIQIIPLLDRPKFALLAVLLSIPGWLVILFAYSNNHAWVVFTLIAPGLLGACLYARHQALPPVKPE